MVDASEALKQVQDWGGAPANSKFVCSTCKSDAGAMAEFFSEVSSGQKGAAEPMIFVAPNCRSATDTKAMQRLVEHLKRSCDSANVQYLEGAPQPALSMLPQVSAPEPQTDLTQEEVMGTVLDWFQSMLVTLTDEEDFIEIGRILLSVKKYTVNNAVSPERFQAGFWAEVAKLVEAGEDGNSMMVAPNFMLDDLQGFEAFVHRQLEQPLAEWAREGRDLRVSFFHPKGSKNSPWPIIQIYFFDPAPPKNEECADVDFDAEIDWGQTTKEDLLEAKARAQAQGKEAATPPMPPSIPLEVDPFKGFGNTPDKKSK